MASLAVVLLVGCRSSEWHLREANRRSLEQIDRIGYEQTGRATPYRFDSPQENFRRRLLLDQQLPTQPALPSGDSVVSAEVPLLSLEDALRVGAAHSREYQNRKEAIFRAALALDVESEEFRTSWAGAMSGQYRNDLSAEPKRRDAAASFEPAVSRLFAAGASVTTRLALDLTRLLTLERDTAYGLLADASVTLPLLRGAGRRIVLEPLTLAERQVVYAMYDFERFKHVFAVRVASEYLGVLERSQQIDNADDNYRRLALSTQRAEKMAEAGRLPATQVDQTRQDLLRARERLISSRQDYQGQFDEFKRSLGLPVDADIRLDPAELDRLAGVVAEGDAGDTHAVPVWEREPEWRGESSSDVVRMALENRLDLRRLEGRIADARRGVEVARDQLRGAVKLEAGATYGDRREIGSGDREDARIRPSKGRYRAILQWDPPWRRTRERNRYRESLLDLDRALRDYEEQEDVVKLQIRAHLRGLSQTGESRRIQARAVQLAERRVESTELFLQAGRAQIRDVLEAQEALVSARNALLAAAVRYRTTEWNLQRDMDLLQVTDEGSWNGYDVDE